MVHPPSPGKWGWIFGMRPPEVRDNITRKLMAGTKILHFYPSLLVYSAKMQSHCRQPPERRERNKYVVFMWVDNSAGWWLFFKSAAMLRVNEKNSEMVFKKRIFVECMILMMTLRGLIYGFSFDYSIFILFHFKISIS